MSIVKIGGNNKKINIFLIAIALLFLLYSANSINFNGSSPVTGQSDTGNISGIFSSQTGTFNDTITLNNIYFGVERNNGGTASANMSLGFNVSYLAYNSSIKITGLNASMTYCHSRRVNNVCDGAQGANNPQGTSAAMYMWIQNASSSSFINIGGLIPTNNNTLITLTNFSLPINSNYSSFINSSGFINIRIEFRWSGTGFSAFLNDLTNLTLTYDSKPNVVLSSPANNTLYGLNQNVSVICNSTDDNRLINITLFHNINGSFIANQTANISGTSNSTMFNLTNIGTGTYLWNCLASDNVTGSSFSYQNYSFTIQDTVAPVVTFVSPTQSNGYNQSSTTYTINVTSVDSNNNIDSCRLEWNNVNESMTKIGSGSSVYCNITKTIIFDSTYTYKVYSNDSQNNIGNTSERTITIDTTDPVVNFVAPTDSSNSLISKNNTFINITATDSLTIDSCTLQWNNVNQSLIKSVNGSSNIVCYINKTSLVDGLYNYTVFVNDSLNNMYISESRNLTISTNRPLVSFVSPTQSNGYNQSNNNITINITSSDSINIDSCILQWNNVNESMTEYRSGTNITCTTIKSNLLDNTYTYKVYSNNTLNLFGNTSERTITIDTTDPVVNFVAPTDSSNSLISRNNTFINITATDSLTIDSCTLQWNNVNQSLIKSVNGSSNIVCYINKTSLVDGLYNYTVFVNDSLNNMYISPIRYITVSSSVPLISFTSPTDSDNSYINRNNTYINISVVSNTASTIDSCILQWNNVNESMTMLGNGTSVYCYTNKTSLTDGSYSYKIFVNNSLSLLSETGSRYLVVDTVSPTIEFVSPTQSSGYNQSSNTIIINITSSDITSNISSCLLQLNNINYSMSKTSEGLNVSCTLTVSGLSDNNYNYFAISNDTTNNIGRSATRTLTIDSTPPNITFVMPTDSNNAFVTRNNIFINTSINSSLLTTDSCILQWNNVNESMTKSDVGLLTYCYINKTSLTDGLYNYTVFANDTINNLGSSSRNITIDTTLLVDYANPTPNDSINQSNNNVIVNVTVYDSLANISSCTLQWNNVNESMVLSSLGNNISCYKPKLGLVDGIYSFKVFVNTTSNNINQTSLRTIIIDANPPIISFVNPTPSNASYKAVTSQLINTSNYDNLTLVDSCILEWLYSNQTMSKISSGYNVTCNYLETSLTDGLYSFRGFANDTLGNLNYTNLRFFTVDNTAPTFTSLKTTPNSTDLLDPGTIITATAVVSDSSSGIDQVILQYKTDSTEFTNLTMNYVSATSSYNTTFNATSAANYTLRLFANDTLGNSNLSNSINFTTAYDYTWNRNPITFSPVNAIANQIYNLGLLTINNTGDYDLDFYIASSYAQTSFNESFPITVIKGNNRSVNITLIAPSTNSVTEITFNVNSTNSNANPIQQNSSVTLVVSQDALLVSTFVTYPSTVSQGSNNIFLSSRLDNSGQKNATNVTFYYVLPSDWVLVSGTLNLSVNDLYASEYATHNIEVRIPSDATTGQRTVIINASGNNETGYSLQLLNNLYGASKNITVTAAESSLGSLLSTSSSNTVVSITSGGGSSGSGGVAKSPNSETIYSSNIIRATSGNLQKGIPITITNPYSNSYIQNISLEVQGYFSHYVNLTQIMEYKKIYTETNNLFINSKNIPIFFNISGYNQHSLTLRSNDNESALLTLRSEPINITLIKGLIVPVDLDNDSKYDVDINLTGIINNTVYLDINKIGYPNPNRIYYNENRNYSLSLFIPSYLLKQEINLTIKITADVIPLNSEAAGFNSKKLTEYRDLILKVYEVSNEDSKKSLELARSYIKEMELAGFPVAKTKLIFDEAEKELNNFNFERSKYLSDNIKYVRDQAFETDSLIHKISQGIIEANLRFLKTYDTERSLELVKKAFAREDYDTALQRAKEAELTLILETKGKINIFWVIAKYWWLIILSLIILSTLVFFLYTVLMKNIISFRLNKIEIEQTNIKSLLEDLENKMFVKSSISDKEYKNSKLQYESRLNKLDQMKTHLLSKKISLMSDEQELMNIQKEIKETKDSMKKLQEDYFKKGKISKTKYETSYNMYKERLAEIEEEKDLYEKKLKKEKTTLKYKIISLFKRK